MVSICLMSCVGFCGPLPSRVGAELVEMLIKIAYYIAEIMAIRFQIFPIDQDACKLLAIPNEMKLSINNRNTSLSSISYLTQSKVC
jgi:hypothetical protein